MKLEVSWKFIFGELTEQQRIQWQQLDQQCKLGCASSTLTFAENAPLLLSDGERFYAFGYIEESLVFAIPLTKKHTNKYGFKTCYIQITSHNHIDFYTAAGQNEANEEAMIVSLVSALKTQVNHWDLFFSRRWYFQSLKTQAITSRTYSRTAAYFSLDGKSEIKQVLPKKLVKNLLRFERKLTNSDSGLQLQIIKEKTEIQEALDQFYRVEASGWKAKAGSAIGINTDIREFYDQSWKSFANTGNGVVFLLTTEEQCIAAGVAYLKNNTVYLHKIAYDESLAKLSPGSILVKRIVEYAMAQEEIMKICFNTNPGWISRWHPDIAQLWAIQAFNSSVKGQLIRIGSFFYRNLKSIKNRIVTKK